MPKKSIKLLANQVFTDISDKSCAVVYTDGSCLYQGTENAKAGFGVFWEPDHPNNYSGKVHGLQDINRAELCGAHHAIKQAFDQGYPAIKVVSDSKFVGLVINNPKNFRGSSHADVHDIMDSIDSMRPHIKITVKYIKAHVGHYGNEEADRLAKIGVRTLSLETVYRYWTKLKKFSAERQKSSGGKKRNSGNLVPSVAKKVDKKHQKNRGKPGKKAPKLGEKEASLVPVQGSPTTVIPAKKTQRTFRRTKRTKKSENSLSETIKNLVRQLSVTSLPGVTGLSKRVWRRKSKAENPNENVEGNAKNVPAMKGKSAGKSKVGGRKLAKKEGNSTAATS